MDPIELKPYPTPSDIEVPNLMPFQLYPWNGDGYLAAEVLRLKALHGLKTAMETGTCLGSTTIWLANIFDQVTTCEISEEYVKIARCRLAGHDNVDSRWERSQVITYLAGPHDFYFLDAHWGDHCPLLSELDFISTHGHKPCILIHDFLVPGTDFGYDKMPDGRPFDMDLIREHLDTIYGEGGWKHNYPTQVAGARRGWISIEPC